MTEPRNRIVTFYEAPARLTVTDGRAGPEAAAVPVTLTLAVEYTTDNGHDVVRLPNGMLLELP